MLRRGILRDVFDRYALPGVGFNVVPARRQFGYLDIPNKTVIHRNALFSFLAYTFRLKYVDVVDQLLQQRTCEHLYLKKPSDLRYELFLPELERVGFGEVFAQTVDLVFEFQPLRLILLRHVHEPFLRNLVLGVILEQFFVQTGDLVAAGKYPVDLFLQILLLLENITVSLVRQDLDEGVLVVPKKLGETAKLQQYDLFDSVRTDIVPCGTSAAIVFGVIGAREKVDFLSEQILFLHP